MTIPNEEVELTKKMRAKLAEWGSKGGKAGSREDKIRAVKIAWAGPNKPGRKKKTTSAESTSAQPEHYNP